MSFPTAPFAAILAACISGLATAAPMAPAPTPGSAIEAVDGAEAPLPDPPARVGRVARLQASVGYRAAGETQWTAAGINLPVAGGTALQVEPGARALLELPGATLALEGGSALVLDLLDDSALRVTLSHGGLGLELAAMQLGDVVEVATPAGIVGIRKPGRYLVEAGEADRPARLVVYQGQAGFTDPAGTVRRVGTGQAVVASDGLVLESAGPPSPLLAWAQGGPGDKAGPHPAAVAAMPGGALLSRYGRWSTHPEYGDVWRPQVEAGWTPFRDGHWRDVAPWGWSWVDDAPWGFAPAHYGRWYVDSGAWYWAPRPFGLARGPRWPVYAPAVVRFAGGGGRPVGWAPLAPREAFLPGPRFSPRYLRQVNLSAVPPGFSARPLPGDFARLANARGASVVPMGVFHRSYPVGPNLLRGPGALADIGPARLPGRPPGGLAGPVPGAGVTSFGRPAPGFARPGPPAQALVSPGNPAARPFPTPGAGFGARPSGAVPPRSFMSPESFDGARNWGAQPPVASYSPQSRGVNPAPPATPRITAPGSRGFHAPSAAAPGYAPRGFNTAPNYGPRGFNAPSYAAPGYGGRDFSPPSYAVPGSGPRGFTARPDAPPGYASRGFNPPSYASPSPGYAPRAFNPPAFAPQPSFQARPGPAPQAQAAPRGYSPPPGMSRPSFGGHRR